MRTSRKLWLAGLLVFALSLFARVSTVNTQLDVGTDESQYLGAARDLLTTGSFEESVGKEAFGHFLPVGYPTLIAATAYVFSLTPSEAGIWVSVAMGSLIPILAFGFLAWVLGTVWIPLAGGIFLAFSWPMIYYSTVVMTESTVLVLYLLVLWLTIGASRVAERRTFFSLTAATGIGVGLSYLVRAGSLQLIGTVPVVLLVLNKWTQRRSWSQLAGGLGLFGLCAALIVGWNSHRLYQRTGVLTLNPQIGGNVAVGDLITKGDLSVVKLNPEATYLNLKSRVKSSTKPLSELLLTPIYRSIQFTKSLTANLSFFGEGLFNLSKEAKTYFGRNLLLATLALLGFLFFSGTQPNGAKSQPLSSKAQEAWIASGLFLVLHIMAYSLFMPWRRYVEQAIPYFVLFAGPTLYVVVQSLRHRLNPPAAGSFLVATGVFFILWGTIDSSAVHHLGWKTRNRTQFVGQQQTQRAGKEIKQIAEARGEVPRVMSLNLAYAYYGEGYGYAVPYTEENPQQLLKYIRHHHINFVSTPKGLKLAEGIGGIMGIPLFHVLALLSETYPAGISFDEPERYFAIRLENFPTLNEVASIQNPERSYSPLLDHGGLSHNPTPDLLLEFEKEWARVSLDDQCAVPASHQTKWNLEPDRKYLVHTRYTSVHFGWDWEYFPHSPRVAFRNDGNSLPLDQRSNAVIVGRDGRAIQAFQYLVLDTQGLSNPVIEFSQYPASQRESQLRDVVLYEMNLPENSLRQGAE